VEDRRADHRHRRHQSHQRHRHDLNRDAPLDAVQQVLARVLAVAEVAGSGDGEDGLRPRGHVGPVAAEEGQHLGHARDAVLGERARHHRPLRLGEHQVQPPGIGNRRRHVGRGKSRGQISDVLQPAGQPHVVHEVGRQRQPPRARSVVEDVQPAGAGHEMHPVAGQGGMALAGPVVEGNRAWRAGQGMVNHIWREEHALPRGVQRQARVKQPLAQRQPAHLDADLSQDAFGVSEDGVDLWRCEDLESWTHGV